MPASADPTSEWVAVYSRTTGERHEVPASWLDTPLMEPFRKTPLSAEQQAKADKAAATN